MNESDFTDDLQTAMENDAMGLFQGATIRSFEDAGLLTMNKGLVVRLDDGSEFQVTVVQSRRGEGDEA